MPGFIVEYAKSGRSSCKGCMKPIGQGELRIGRMVQSPHFDGEVPQWHHVSCLFKKHSIGDLTLLVGFAGLRPEDQQKLKSKVSGGAAAASSSSSAAASAAAVILPPSIAQQELIVEYAKSSRATCVKCNSNIEASTLRIGRMEQSDKFDGKIPRWFHEECAWKQLVIVSQASLDGFDKLRSDDQKRIKSQIDSTSPLAASSSSSSEAEPPASKKSGKRARGKGEEEGESAAAKRKKVKQEDAEPTPDYQSMSVAELKAACKEKGLEVKGKKQDLIDRITALSSSSSSSSSSTAASNKAVDPEEAAAEAAIADESKIRWSMIDKLNDLSTGELKQLLELNQQPSNGGRDKLLDQIADGLMYGALPACSECGHHSLTYEHGAYVCKGYSSEWGRCLFTAPDVKRKKFDVEGVSNAFLDKFKFKFMKKPLEAHQFFAKKIKKIQEAAQAANAAAEAIIQKKQSELDKQSRLEILFKDMTFCFVGKFSLALPKLKKLVEEHGGEVTNDVAQCDMVITSQEQVDKDKKNKIIQEAIEDTLPLLSEAFIHDSISKLELQDPTGYKIKCAQIPDDGDDENSQWGSFKQRLQEIKQKSGAQLAKSSGKSVSSSFKSNGGNKMKVKVKGRGVVDEESKLADTAHILEEGKDVYNVVLNLTDISAGINSYYLLQLIEDDNGKNWHVFRKWGRVGTTIGGTKLTSYKSKNSAREEWDAVYLDKTANHWSNHHKFQKVPGKFYPIEVDYEADDQLTSSQTSSQPSKLDVRIQDIVKTFFDINTMKAAMVEMELDLEKMPLGKLSKAHIQKGFDALTEIQQIIKEQPSNMESLLLAASNKFYTLIPHDFGTQNPPILRDEEQIKAKLEIVETLLEIEVATKLLKASSGDMQGENPIDVHYKQLHTDMRVLEKEDKEYQLISTYIKNTHAPTHTNYSLDLLEAICVDRENEADRYSEFSNNHNRMLLWHGSRTTNFVGILSEGLRIAPPSAPVTGYMFGKGVYFADLVSKSANYCYTNTSNNIGFLLLCEVALGDMNELKHAEYMDEAPAGKLSTKGLGTNVPDPSGNIQLDNGCVVPAGKPKKIGLASDLLYNEYIVYSVKQIRMKYLLKVRFNYASRW